VTDRTLRGPADLASLRFDERGLVPVVAQDADSGRVLMVAWANHDALEQSFRTGEMHFWSRSRGQLWKKGETSGNVLELRSLHADCDGDTVLARVRPTGPACHTGEPTCFGELGGTLGADVISDLWAVIDERARTLPEKSYTTKLLGDENLRLKKLGEETTELVAALARGQTDRVPEEAADLLYHLLVAVRGAGAELAAVLAALDARRR
jgi:phosphoribosyl-ATP pyrophosphohydrolase/phosphoribosyl-AMP cyclohydrolase